MNIAKFRELSSWLDSRKGLVKDGISKKIANKEYIKRFSGHGNNVSETVANVFLDNLSLSLKTGNTFILITAFKWAKQVMKAKGLDANQFIEYILDVTDESGIIIQETLTDDTIKLKWQELFEGLKEEFTNQNKK